MIKHCILIIYIKLFWLFLVQTCLMMFLQLRAVLTHSHYLFICLLVCFYSFIHSFIPKPMKIPTTVSFPPHLKWWKWHFWNKMANSFVLLYHFMYSKHTRLHFHTFCIINCSMIGNTHNKYSAHIYSDFFFSLHITCLTFSQGHNLTLLSPW